MAVDSIKHTIGVAFGVCLVCSVLVSTTSVTLKKVQDDNKKLDKMKNILIAGELYTTAAEIEEVYNDKIEAEILELSSGLLLPEEKYNQSLDAQSFDIRAVAEDPEYNRKIPADKDIAQIKYMPKYMAIYLAKEGNDVKKYILPIYGKGLWSTMYGFIALDTKLETIEGFTFYEHGETPGLGGEIDNPRWKKIWKGKKAFDPTGKVKITVIKGLVNKTRPEAKYQVDGLSGATITTKGVDQLVKFWLGSEGYGPSIKKLRKGRRN